MDDSEEMQALLCLREYLKQECVPISRGVAFRLRLDRISQDRVPISVPTSTLAEMQEVRYISGTISEKACNIVLEDSQARTIAALRTAKRGLFGIVWERPTLTDDEFSNGLSGCFPLCFNGDELRLWPMDVLLACISPVSLNSPNDYVFAERSGIVVRSSSAIAKEFIFNSKIPDAWSDTVLLDYADDLPACVCVTRGVIPRSSCREGRYPALAGHAEHSGKKVPLGAKYAVYDHVHAQLLNGIEFAAVVLELRFLAQGD